ncbi:alpha/beta hydrolase [Chthonobacter rhizosphaerae]|uniref:alpha/beta hydrolase n=1 Tax=Chthonobacter rhizosphaerae TaxID=2735553 RepID=UPI001FE4C790|nr:alpha/beta hydrolase [Chthonobacter rhizosphaerae]
MKSLSFPAFAIALSVGVSSIAIAQTTVPGATTVNPTETENDAGTIEQMTPGNEPVTGVPNARPRGSASGGSGTGGSGSGGTTAAESAAIAADPMARADDDMKAVLDALASLDPKPIAELSPEEARRQPSPADAVKKVLEGRNQGQDQAQAEGGQAAAPEGGVTTEDVSFPGAETEIPARIYKPEGASGPLPVVLYFHGGGWVIADLDTYDATPRAMAEAANAIVVSAHYRQAPEHKFPAAHDDAVAAYRWVLEKAESWGGDPAKIAVMGESAGGNLAINVSMAARELNLQMPVHQVLVYPVAGVDTNTKSYMENADAKPLNKPMMEWFVKQVVANESDKQDPRINLVGEADMSGLPPTTLITAEIDPLQTEGQQLANKLQEAGVPVNGRTYLGVTHEFFGMADVVADAKDAQELAAADLRAAFEKTPSGVTKTGSADGAAPETDATTAGAPAPEADMNAGAPATGPAPSGTAAGGSATGTTPNTGAVTPPPPTDRPDTPDAPTPADRPTPSASPEPGPVPPETPEERPAQP